MGNKSKNTGNNNSGNNQQGLFNEPKKPCQHPATRKNEHQEICTSCQTVVSESPH